MKKLSVASLMASLLTAATAFAAERPAVPAKGTEGPDIRATERAPSTVPVKGGGGPGTR
jgi:hypothetical protein